MGKELIMAKFTLVAVKGTDININVEAEMTPAEVAQVLVTSRDSLKDLIGLLHEAKSTAKEFYEEFKPILQRRAAVALDRDGSSWVREEEMSRIKHEIEMEKLRQELAELKAKSDEKIHEAEVERIKSLTLARAERYSRNTVTGSDACAKTDVDSNSVTRVTTANGNMGTVLNEAVSRSNSPEDTPTNDVVAHIPNNGDFSRRVDTTAGNETLSGVRVVRLGNDEIHSRRIAETTATVR